jgi:AraC-like DNA-binding protein
MANPVILRTEQDIAWSPECDPHTRDAMRMRTFAHRQGPLVRLRPTKVSFYLKVARRLGFDSDQVLAGTGITAADLADPRYLVEVAKYVRIVSNMHRLSESPALAFTLGDHLTLGDLGILGYSVMTSETSDEATRLWLQYIPVFFGNLVELAFDSVGDQLLLTYLPYADIRGELLQFLIEEKICCEMALQRLIGMPEYPIERLTLTYPEPAHIDRYRALIKRAIEFSAPRNTVLLSSNALRIPLQGHDPETHRHCLKLLTDVNNSVNAGSTLSHEVKAILHRNLQHQLTIDDVAGQLHCTARTLNRKLEKESLNFSQLYVATRLEAIENMLATTNLETCQIADRVGFSDVRSLRRFFKTHTGKTIQQFRADALGDCSSFTIVHT